MTAWRSLAAAAAGICGVRFTPESCRDCHRPARQLRAVSDQSAVQQIEKALRRLHGGTTAGPATTRSSWWITMRSGTGVDFDRMTDCTGHHRVLVVVEAHQTGLRDGCRQRVESVEPGRFVFMPDTAVPARANWLTLS